MNKRTIIHIEPTEPIRVIDLEHILSSIRMMCEEELSFLTERYKRNYADNIRISQVEKGSIIMDMLTELWDLKPIFSLVGIFVKLLSRKKEKHSINVTGNNAPVIVGNNNNITNITYNNTYVFASRKGHECSRYEQLLYSAIKKGNTVTFMEEDGAVKIWKDSTTGEICVRFVQVPEATANKMNQMFPNSNVHIAEFLNNLF